MTILRQFHDRPSGRLAYLLADTDRREAVIIDPAPGEATLVLGLLDELRCRAVHVLLTHAHGPEIAGALELREAAGARLVVGDRCPLDLPGTLRRVREGDTVVFGDEALRCRETPGHTRGCMTYLWRDRAFVGDLLPGYGADAAEHGEEDPGSRYDSLVRKLLALPDETLVYPAHGIAGRRVTCVGEQRDANPALTGASRDEFIAHQARARQAVLIPTSMQEARRHS
ncbi:MAG: MBL fold metallo-hydrolase [Rhodocyclaceae bacterium]|nr:MBL fold metallo-hydrolase [Rhodocyclaceae bacterium]